MTRILAMLALGGLALATPAAGQNRDQPSSDRIAGEVEQLERQLVKAIAATDLATYDRLVADDYVVIDASGREITKRDVMESYRSGSRRYPGLEITQVKAHVFGDTAIVSARTLGTRRENGKDVPNLVRYLRVYARRGGSWQAVSQMSTPLPAR